MAKHAITQVWFESQLQAISKLVDISDNQASVRVERLEEGGITYLRRRIALECLPKAPEVDLTEGDLDDVLDLLENGFTAWPQAAQTMASEEPSAHLPAAAGSSEPMPGVMPTKTLMALALRMTSFGSWPVRCGPSDDDIARPWLAYKAAGSTQLAAAHSIRRLPDRP